MYNDDELYHSDVYLGKEYSDGIRHWKYIKRIKLPNGKYRYYYDTLDNLDKYQEKANKARNYAGMSLISKKQLEEAADNYKGDPKDQWSTMKKFKADEENYRSKANELIKELENYSIRGRIKSAINSAKNFLNKIASNFSVTRSTSIEISVEKVKK